MCASYVNLPSRLHPSHNFFGGTRRWSQKPNSLSVALKLSIEACRLAPSGPLKSVSNALAKAASRFPSLDSNEALARVIRNSLDTPYCSNRSSGFCTSISVLILNVSTFPSSDTLTESLSMLIFGTPGLSFSRRKLMRFATASGSPISGKVERLPLASIPFSSRRTRVGKLNDTPQRGLMRLSRSTTKGHFSHVISAINLPLNSDDLGFRHVSGSENT